MSISRGVLILNRTFLVPRKGEIGATLRYQRSHRLNVALAAGILHTFYGNHAAQIALPEFTFFEVLEKTILGVPPN